MRVMKRTTPMLVFTFGLAAGLVGCSQSSSTTQSPAPFCAPISEGSPALSSNNVLPVTVGKHYVNEITVSVTICVPGTSNCQTVPDVLLDTGSYGLRLFNCAVSLNLPGQASTVSPSGSISTSNNPTVITSLSSLAGIAPGMSISGAGIPAGAEVVSLSAGSSSVTMSAPATSTASSETISFTGSLAECVSYADTTSHWGPIKLADVALSNAERASSVPIEIIDANYSTVPDTCINLEHSPQLTGYNGIIGVGLWTQDCGTQCTSGNDPEGQNGLYFACGSSSCNGTYLPLNQQTTNPVSMLAGSDNNGVVLTLPAVNRAGASTIQGTMALGINTASGNNTAGGGVVAYHADANAFFETDFNGGSLPGSFIDSGSNALFFPSGSSTASVATCDISQSLFFCPSTIAPLQATQKGVGDNHNNAVTFYVGNASSIFVGGNPSGAWSTVAAEGGTDFDWGLPFFMGRSIFVGIENASGGGTLGTGPFWAYDPSANPPAP